MRSFFYRREAKQGKAFLSLSFASRLNFRTTLRTPSEQLPVSDQTGKAGLLEAVDCKLTAIGSERNVVSTGSRTSGGYLSSNRHAKAFHLVPATSDAEVGLCQTRSIRSENISPGHLADIKKIHHRDVILNLQSIRHGHHLSNEWLAARLMADRKRRQLKAKRLQAASGAGVQDQTTVFTPAEELGVAPRLSQPPPTQPLRGSLKPASEEEEKLALVMARPDLLVTRNIEWANIAFGFEQQNRYVIVDPRQPHAPVGYILEESAWFLRQLLRTRRPFLASVLDGNGVEVFRVRRPMWLINSAIYVEVDGKVVGEAHSRWHLWRRIYDLYLGTKQFATVENPGFWHWTFSLKDRDGRMLAEIDRNWRGFGYEFLTDAGQYVIRFGLPGLPGVTIQTAETQVEPLVVDRPLNLLERAVALALAVSLDNDYFSRHTGSFGGFHLPFFGSGDLAGTDGVASDVPSDGSGSGSSVDDRSVGRTTQSPQSDWVDSYDKSQFAEDAFAEKAEDVSQSSGDDGGWGDVFGSIFGGGESRDDTGFGDWGGDGGDGGD